MRNSSTSLYIPRRGIRNRHQSKPILCKKAVYNSGQYAKEICFPQRFLRVCTKTFCHWLWRQLLWIDNRCMDACYKCTGFHGGVLGKNCQIPHWAETPKLIVEAAMPPCVPADCGIFNLGENCPKRQAPRVVREISETWRSRACVSPETPACPLSLRPKGNRATWRCRPVPECPPARRVRH